MIPLSIYTQAFNLESMGFAWRDTLANWLRFLNDSGQIVIAVNVSTDDTSNLIRRWRDDYMVNHPSCKTKIDVLDIDIPYTDPAFDGKGKAAALAYCKETYCLLLDMDEMLVSSQRQQWFNLIKELERGPVQVDGFLIPSVDLFHDKKHFKSIGQKFYLHRNRPNLTRGVVKWAYREDGSVDITKSDTTELIRADTGELAHCVSIVMALPDYMKILQLNGGDIPFVYHLGYLNKEQRLKQDAFWEPVWRNRDQSDVKTAKSLVELEKIQFYPHSLPPYE